ncbi:hypothetical protein FOZ60_009860 [Perkinsus olseni]|uniref:Uncharacterized protein n=1 Tax=Perkinsus olseni TaxID=32597 RepID=A0A7J6PM75_PEROL|nr:hypothetical protein FOZ60_009860 [Perkinsus olseni]
MITNQYYLIHHPCALGDQPVRESSSKCVLQGGVWRLGQQVPLIEKELGDVKFLFVDPSTLRLCESSGEEVSSLDFDPFDERLTRKLGFSVVELGCCRALAVARYGTSDPSFPLPSPLASELVCRWPTSYYMVTRLRPVI